MLAVLMMTPRCPSTSGSVAAMASAATASTVNEPIRLISTTLRNSARSCTPLRPTMRADGPMPAQLTTVRSGRAGSSDARATAARTCSSDVTSVGAYSTPSTAGPDAQASGRSRATTRAPWAARAAAVAAPSPEAPPVTMAVVFASCMAVILPPARGPPPASVAGRTVGAMELRIGAHVDQTDPVAEAQARGRHAGASSSSATRRATRAPSRAVRRRRRGAASRRPRRPASTSTCTRPTSSTSPPTNNRIRIPSRKLLQQHMRRRGRDRRQGR